MKRSISLKVLVVLASVAFLAGLSTMAAAKDILIGGLMDTTGATSDVGKDYAIGMQDAFKYFNDHGGVNGKMIKYTWFDYGYRIPESITKYKMLKRMGAVAIMGWGTGDTEALSPSVNKDKTPYISASYSANLTDPKKTRYNLFFPADYSTQARACVTAWFEKKWKNHPDYGKRKPRFACCYMFASPYASAPIKAAKDQAAFLGFDVGSDQDISLFALDTKSQIMALESFKPDLLWHGNTTMATAATMRDAYALKLGASWIVNTYGFDENLPRLAGEAGEGAMGVTPGLFFNAPNTKNMDIVVAAAEKYSPGIPLSKRTLQTVKAWGDALMTWEALKRADKKGIDVTDPNAGEGIVKEGFETLRDYDVGLGAAPITLTATDHRPASRAIVQEWRGGKFQVVDTIDLKQRWPEEWASKWFGW